MRSIRSGNTDDDESGLVRRALVVREEKREKEGENK